MAMSYPLRVGLLLDHPSPHMFGLLEALATRRDIVARVLYLRCSDPERNWSTPFEPLPHTFVADSGGLGRSLVHPAVDVWVVGSVYTSLATWRAVRCIQAKLSIPWVYMNEPMRRRGYLVDWLKRLVVGKLVAGTSGFAMTGDAAAVEVQERIAKGRPCASVPYFIPLQVFYDIPREQPDASTYRDLDTIPVEATRFACVAQMVPRKRQNLLLDAFVPFADDDWTLDLVGDGPQRASLEAKAAPFGEKVRFRGFVPYEGRHRAFANVDVVILNSVFDGWGVVVQEALAAGCAVIATRRVMAALDLVRDGENGYLVPVDDEIALGAALGKCIEQPVRTRRMGVAGREGLSRFSVLDARDRLVGLLQSAVRQAESKVVVNRGPVNSVRLQGAIVHRNRPRQWLRRAALNAMGLACAQRPRTGDRILAYHFVLDDQVRRFESHLSYLQDHFELTSLTSIVRGAPAGEGTHSRVAITFDDGFQHLMGRCLDLLDAKGVTASFFVPTAFTRVAGDDAQEAAFCQKAHGLNLWMPAMSVEDLRHLRDAGHEVGSHGVQHLSLSAVTADRAREELVGSRETLAEWLGKKPLGSAYPYGDQHSRLGSCAKWVEQAGYEYAVTMKRGVVEAGSPVFQLPREHVEGHWRLADLRVFLSR